MKLKDKIFVVVDDLPTITPIGINIPEFKKLWAMDKSEGKTKFAKWIAYIYHMWEYDSPYYDLENKEERIKLDIMGSKSWKPSKSLTKALEAYIELDNTADKRVLDASTASCDKIAKDLSQYKADSETMDNLMLEIDYEIKQSDDINAKMELMDKKLKLQELKMKTAKMVVETMPKLEKAIETNISLRKKVTTSVYKGENTSSTIGKSLYDVLMGELDYEDYESGNKR